jgi:hypothetical protein
MLVRSTTAVLVQTALAGHAEQGAIASRGAWRGEANAQFGWAPGVEDACLCAVPLQCWYTVCALAEHAEQGATARHGVQRERGADI